jgi:hypothetical protein
MLKKPPQVRNPSRFRNLFWQLRIDLKEDVPGVYELCWRPRTLWKRWQGREIGDVDADQPFNNRGKVQRKTLCDPTSPIVSDEDGMRDPQGVKQALDVCRQGALILASVVGYRVAHPA